MTPFKIRQRVKRLIKEALGLKEFDGHPPGDPPVWKPPATPTSKAAPRTGAAVRPMPPGDFKPPPEGPPPPGDFWYQVAKLDELSPGEARSVEARGKLFAIYNTGEQIFATRDACPACQAALGKGALDGAEISCPKGEHSFDVRTGESTSGAEIDAEAVRVKVRKNRVLLAL